MECQSVPYSLQRNMEFGSCVQFMQAEFAANPDFVYSERITKEQSVAVLKVRTNVYVFVQGLPGCLPWGVLLTYLTDFLAQNKGLTVEKATVVSNQCY